jgi:hypothetical protein
MVADVLSRIGLGTGWETGCAVFGVDVGSTHVVFTVASMVAPDVTVVPQLLYKTGTTAKLTASPGGLATVIVPSLNAVLRARLKHVLGTALITGFATDFFVCVTSRRRCSSGPFSKSTARCTDLREKQKSEE